MYDLIVIGAGVGGYTAAIRAAKEKMKVAIVEKDKVGGTCLNRGCIPTKYMINAAGRYRSCLENLETQKYHGEIELDYGNILQDMEKKVERLSKGIQSLISAGKIDFFRGNATFADDGGVLIDCNTTIYADNIIIATGSEPGTLDIPGINSEGVYTTDNIFREMKKIPQSLLIIGAGAAGLEMAFLFADLGTQVTLVECSDRFLGMADTDVDGVLRKAMKKHGINYYLSSRVAEIVPDDELRINVKLPSEELWLKAQMVMVATGRNAVLRSLSLEKAGVKTTNYEIPVDENFQTNVLGIYAIGDVNRKNMLAYAAAAQGIHVVGHILGKQFQKETLIPSCIFTNPEIGIVGLTEERAREENIEISVGKFLMSANGRSVTEGHDGFVKLISDADTGEILGGTCVCHAATELISQITIAIQNEMTVEQLRRTIFPHPTYSEAIGEAAEMESGTSVYML